MCTIGYNRRTNTIFKVRDKNVPTNEVSLIQPNVLALKTEGASYFSTGINNSGCAFVSAAVNTPEWIALAGQGKVAEAAEQAAAENAGLVNPMIIVSQLLPEVATARELLDRLLDCGKKFMGYQVLLADKEHAFHVELYKCDSHVVEIEESVAVTNHFKHLDHGPREFADYPSSFERLEEANQVVSTFRSIEDVFNTLKPRNGEKRRLWRTGNGFFTISASVIDLDSECIYYSCSPYGDYSRISGHIPPKGAQKVAIEMSRYIDLPTYHKIERAHPFYEEMIEDILKQIDLFKQENAERSNSVTTLELGAGTGLCSLELAGLDGIDLHCLEIDQACCKVLEQHPEARGYRVVQGDAVEYRSEKPYDLIVSTFAHDHIHYDRRYTFARNIYDNLAKGGRYMMGGEILPYFSSDSERKKSLFLYHNFIISLALQKDRIQLCELENNALKSGLNLVGDFKRHEAMFEEEMESSGLKLVTKNKMGPLDREDIGGVFVYVYEK